MKKKHQIKTIDDIKYCEEHGVTIYSDTWEPDFFKFDNGVWCMYSDNELKFYNSSFDVSYDELYYYEEEPEEQQEVTEKDVGKLCWGWNTYNEEKDLGVLKEVEKEESDKYHLIGLGWFEHCRPLTKAEIQEFMERAE